MSLFLKLIFCILSENAKWILEYIMMLLYKKYHVLDFNSE